MTLEEFKAELLVTGFRTAPNPTRNRNNLCSWYAYKASALPARECETNDGKPAQVVIEPFVYVLDNEPYVSCEVNLRGETNGIWFDMKAYALTFEEAIDRLPDVEKSLIAAWNALAPA